MDLLALSTSVIKKYQHPSGAYVACPHFDNYRFSWLRDGAFIAYAMDRAGKHDSARAFYGWVHRTLERHADKLVSLLERHGAGEKLEAADFLPCRYTLEGDEARDDWPNFQIDGYGTWLWGLAEHIDMTGNVNLLTEFLPSISNTITYLTTFWTWPNSDCWEENVDKVHPSTLACVYGGLAAINRFLRRDDVVRVASDIRQFLLTKGTHDGRFVKHVGSEDVDASLLWLSTPFAVVSVDHPTMQETVRAMEKSIVVKRGVHRYKEDTYYGGGQWLLLSSWLGWYYALSGRLDDARRQLAWVQSHADSDGLMPEQVLDHVTRTQRSPSTTKSC